MKKIKVGIFGAGRGTDLITGETHDFGGGSELPPYSCKFWRVEG